MLATGAANSWTYAMMLGLSLGFIFNGRTLGDKSREFTCLANGGCSIALTISLGNLWVVDLIGHLGADGFTDLLYQCVGDVTKSTFGNKPSGGSLTCSQVPS
jgi:hypothetical protein